ncbi:MAG: 2,3-bisphosphoglycerate-independent phosphoglycerate mutase [Phycisphaerales bacterium]
MSGPPHNSPLVLIIRDGWGLNPNPSHAAFDATRLARDRGLTPTADRLDRDWPRTLIKTCGEDVGLPEGTMGNSEVGHQNIGAGRIVDQESVAITKACRAGLESNLTIANAIHRAAAGGSSVHLLGIASDAGVHGRLEHLYAIVRACRSLGMPRHKVILHLFTDGRDTGPFTAGGDTGFIAQVEREIAEIGVGVIGSVCGRYYAMDRDHRWERVALAYACLTGRPNALASRAPCPVFPTARAAVEAYYASPTSDSQRGDEFILPSMIGSPEQACATRIGDGDSVIFYNYRGDRPREISAAFVFPDDKWARVKKSPDTGNIGFARGPRLDLEYVIMTEYWEDLLPLVKVAFPKPPRMKNIAGEYVSSLSLRQFRCAETEKYPHVTFFFNDYRDDPFPGETRENPPSPKVATYDQKPEMSAEAVRDAVLRRLAAADCEDFIVVNFANGDMVGHTGVLEAAITACATVDACVAAIITAAMARDGSLIVTADHGNCEQMFDPDTNSPHTAHTLYDVPLYIVGERFRGVTLRGDFDPAGWFDPRVRARRGRLADIAPTALAMLGIAQPVEMTGLSLFADPARR